MVFDLGGVIFNSTAALPALADRIGASPAEFVTAYHAHRKDYDRTSDAEAYWSAVTRDCRVPPLGAEALADLVRQDDLGWAVADPAMLALVTELRPVAHLAVLSNATASMGALVRTLPWVAAFGHVVISGEWGLMKPEPAIYAHLLAALGCPPGRVLFTDDRADNVAGAAACGIRAVRFTGPDALRADLVGLGLLGA